MNIDKHFLGAFGDLKRRKSPPTEIIIHHSCTESAEKTRKVLHKRGLSTCFEVEKDGTIYQYADLMDICQHCSGHNATSIGIDATHIKDAHFPKAQQKAMQRLVWELRKLFNIPKTNVFPHSAFSNTICPNGFPMEIFNEDINEDMPEEQDTIETIRALFTEAIKEGKRGQLEKLIADFGL